MMRRDPAQRLDASSALAQFESIVSTIRPSELEIPVFLYKNLPVKGHEKLLFARMRRKIQKRFIYSVGLILAFIVYNNLTGLLTLGTKRRK